MNSKNSLLLSALLLALTACPSSEPLDSAPLEILTTTLAPGVVGLPYGATLEARGGAGTLRWSAQAGTLPQGIALDASGRLAGTPSGTGAHTVKVEVRDEEEQSAEATFTLAIVEPLLFTSAALSEARTGEFYAVSLDVSGGKRPYAFAVVGGELPRGLEIQGPSIAGIATSDGTSDFVVEASDASGQRSRASFRLTVAPGALRFTAPTLAEVAVGEQVNVQLAPLGGRRPLTFEVASGSLPPGLTLSSSGRLSGAATAAGNFGWTVRVLDSSTPAAEVTATLSLTVLPALQITTTSLRDGAIGEAYDETLSAVGGKPPHRWRLVSSGGAPISLSENGKLTGIFSTTGSYDLQVEVTDEKGRKATANFGLTVTLPSSITTSSVPDAYRGEAYSTQLQISGSGGAVTWSIAAGALPAGLTLGSGGLIAGLPSATGTSNFTVRAVRDGREATRAYTLFTWSPPELIVTAMPASYVGAPFSSQITASGGKAPYSFMVVSGSPPPGVSLSTTGQLSGTPTTPGSHSFSVTALDSNGRAAEAALSITVAQPPQLTGGSLPEGTVGQSYDQQILGAHGFAPLTYTLASGALPRGLTLSTSGRLSGVVGQAGDSSFAVTVTDAHGRSAQANFSLRARLPSSGTFSLRVVGWNVEYFGANNNGPPRSDVVLGDDAVQISNVSTVLLGGGWDLAALVEVVDTTDFQTLVGTMSGYAGVLANDFWVAGGASNYGAGEQKPALIWKTSALTLTSAQIVLAESCFETSTGLPRDAFAGRPPLEVVLESTNTPATTINVYVVHLKAFGTTDDRFRREVASGCLKTYLDALPSDRRALVIGDFNDDVDVSIAGGPSPFANFTQSTGYSFPTAALSSANLSSTVAHGEMIDHQLVNALLGSNYVTGSAAVVRPDLQGIADYRGTTSDHYPVETRYAFGTTSSTPAPYVFINEIRYSERSLNYDEEFVELVNAGDAAADLSGWTLRDGSAVRHVFPAGTSLAPGKAVVVFGGASAIPAGLTNAVAASTGTLSLHPADQLTLYDATTTVIDSHAWSFNLTAGHSDNRSVDGVPGVAFTSHSSVSPLIASPGTKADGSAF